MMGPRCEHCPVEETAWCIGLCEWAATGDPARRAHIVQRSAFGPADTPAEDRTPAVIPAQAGVNIPLAGSLMESAAKFIGAERLARWIEAKTGKSCGCSARRDALNRIDLAIRQFMERKVKL